MNTLHIFCELLGLEVFSIHLKIPHQLRPLYIILPYKNHNSKNVCPTFVN